jgi:hypothetical protein
MEFCDWFEGDFNNWNQAASSPTSFAHIILKHERISDNKFHVTQRYNHETKFYRDVVIEIVERRGVIIVENAQCNLVFRKRKDCYRGSTVDGCIFKETLLVSRAELRSNQYIVIDAGLDPITKEQKWGSTNGPFVFDKKINT